MREVSICLSFYVCLLDFARGASCDEVTQGYLCQSEPVSVRHRLLLSWFLPIVVRYWKKCCLILARKKKKHFLFIRTPLAFAFSTSLWSRRAACDENFYRKMVCQNGFIILLINSLKRTNSVLQEHEEALKKKKEMVLNKKQLTRQD